MRKLTGAIDVEPSVAFVLFVFLGVGEDKRKVSDDPASGLECTRFAQALVQTGQPNHGILLAEDGAINAEGVLMIQEAIIDAIQTVSLVVIIMIARR